MKAIISLMRASKAIIHLENLRHNLGVIRELCPDSKVCLAVKADAYGHGAIPVARAALECGVFALGVAIADEALELRDAGITAPILLYGIPATDEIPSLVNAEIELFCTDKELLALLLDEARVQGKKVRLHLKIDTGMGRIGSCPEDANALAVAAQSGVDAGLAEIAGICTHLPVSDELDLRYTDHQIERFLAIVDTIRAQGIETGLVHVANSGGIGIHPGARLGMVRPGIMAYGYAPADIGFEHLDLRPVMELRSAVCFIKHVPAETPISYGHRWKTPGKRWIGTIPVGYADGLHRLASGRFAMLEAQVPDSAVHTRSFPQVGTICMDQCMIDLGECTHEDEQPPLVRWTELILFGPQKGAATAADIAREAQTIAYEITCGISRRVPRVYVDTVVLRS